MKVPPRFTQSAMPSIASGSRMELLVSTMTLYWSASPRAKSLSMTDPRE